MITPIGIIFGTRPEYLKCKPLFAAFQAANIDFQIIHIKQHKDLDIEEKVFSNYTSIEISEDLGISRLNELASTIPKHLEPVISLCKSVLVQGDTASAFFGSITAFHLTKPIFHLEAGLRTYDVANPFPEEAYRSMISRVTTYHLCPDEQAAENLRKENIHHNIFVVGNTILDLIKSYNFTPQLSNRVLITIHRRENWNILLDIAATIRRIATNTPTLFFDWVLHPNPEIAKRITDYFSDGLCPKNICLLEPLSHLHLSEKIYKAHCIFTDSGGIQEEGSFAGKHIFVIRKVTERNAIPPEYIQIVDDHAKLEMLFLSRTISLLEPCFSYGKGDTCEQIVRIIRFLSGN